MEAMIALLVVGASLAGLVAWRVAAMGRRRRARSEYERLLKQALDDGVLSADELAELESVRERGELSPAEVRMAALAIYRVALNDAARDARLTPEEDASLRGLLEQLQLTESDLGDDLPQLSRLRMLARIAEGNLTEVHSPVALVPDERCHWVVQCTLADRIPTPESTRREPAGTRFAVLGTEPFEAGAQRDALRPAEDVLPSDLGALIVTSRRTIFQGAKRTLSVPHARVDHIALYADGLRLEEIGQARRYFLVDDAELTCAILLQAARQRRAEIRPARPRRHA